MRLLCLLIFLTLLSIPVETALAQNGDPYFNMIYRGPTDPNYTPEFTFGALTFRIPNRLLVFPWPTGQEPKAAKSVFLKLPVNGRTDDSSNPGNISVVTFGYLQPYLYKPYTVEGFSRETDPSSIRKRVPQLDTKLYAAFQNVWTDSYLKQLKIPTTALARLIATNNGQYFFVNKTEGGLKHITCETVLHTSNVYLNLRCTAHQPYMAEKFPLLPDQRYPYSADFDFPGTELDRASEIGAQISDQISQFQRQ